MKQITKEQNSRKYRERYISMNVMFLKYYGLWFYDWENRYLEYLAKVLSLSFSYIIPMFGEIGYAVHNSKNVAQIAEATYLLMAEAELLVKVFFLNYHREIVLDLIKDHSNKEFASRCEEHETIFRKTVSTCRFFIATSIFPSLGIIFSTGLIPLFEETRILPTNMHFPGLDALSTPTYEILYVYNMCYKPVSATLYCCVHLLPAACMFFAVEQLRILAFDMENLQVVADIAEGSNDHKAMLNAVKYCIRRHQFILDYVAKVETAFSVHFAIVFFMTGITICMSGMKMIKMESVLDNPVGWLYALAFLLIVCYMVYVIAYAGNEIKLESENLMTSSFKSAVEADPAVKKLFLILRQRCQTPITVNAGPLCKVTLISFTTLMQWSYKVFAVLNNTDSV